MNPYPVGRKWCPAASYGKIRFDLTVETFTRPDAAGPVSLHISEVQGSRMLSELRRIRRTCGSRQ